MVLLFLAFTLLLLIHSFDYPSERPEVTPIFQKVEQVVSSFALFCPDCPEQGVSKQCVVSLLCLLL